MSEQITGVVQAKKRDGKAVKIEEGWYSARNGSYFASVNRGDKVTLQFSRNGTWLNCDENVAPVVVAVAAAQSGGGSGGYGGKGKQGGRASGFREPDEIIRAEAVSQAVTFLSTTDPDYAGNLPYKDCVERTLRTADLITAYVQGKIDLKKSAQHAAPPPPNTQPAPAPEPEPEPEPQPAPVEQAEVGSALADFLGD